MVGDVVSHPAHVAVSLCIEARALSLDGNLLLYQLVASAEPRIFCCAVDKMKQKDIRKDGENDDNGDTNKLSRCK